MHVVVDEVLTVHPFTEVKLPVQLFEKTHISKVKSKNPAQTYHHVVWSRWSQF